jgi:hypothetical protein
MPMSLWRKRPRLYGRRSGQSSASVNVRIPATRAYGIRSFLILMNNCPAVPTLGNSKPKPADNLLQRHGPNPDACALHDQNSARHGLARSVVVVVLRQSHSPWRATGPWKALHGPVAGCPDQVGQVGPNQFRAGTIKLSEADPTGAWRCGCWTFRIRSPRYPCWVI